MPTRSVCAAQRQPHQTNLSKSYRVGIRLNDTHLLYPCIITSSYSLLFLTMDPSLAALQPCKSPEYNIFNPGF